MLTENFLLELPVSVGKLYNLNTLNVDRNSVQSLPTEIGKLSIYYIYKYYTTNCYNMCYRASMYLYYICCTCFLNLCFSFVRKSEKAWCIVFKRQ